MVKTNEFFTRVVDELVESSEYDPELAEGLRWIDSQARKKGVTIYEMVFEILYKHNADDRQWLSTRN